jgi:hypothetical protein
MAGSGDEPEIGAAAALGFAELAQLAEMLQAQAKYDEFKSLPLIACPLEGTRTPGHLPLVLPRSRTPLAERTPSGLA